MSSLDTTTPMNEYEKHQNLIQRALTKFKRDKVGMFSLFVVLAYLFISLFVSLDLIATDWSELHVFSYQFSSAEFWFGANINGQDILSRALFSTKTAFVVGFTVAFCSTILGCTMGAFAGYFSNTWIDAMIMHLISAIDCIPYYLLVAAVAIALSDSNYSMHIAMISVFWLSTARLIRAEFIKLKNQEFIDAARVLGISDLKIIFKHLLPNTMHLILVELSLLFITAIKSEVILSFLGLGVKESISWGLMIAEASAEIMAGHYANFFAASGFLFVLVLAFNFFSDALQDAFDPKKI